VLQDKFYHPQPHYVTGLPSKLNWTSTPSSLSLQPYTPASLGRVQLEYVSSWTSFTSATYGRFRALHGRTTWLTWRC